MNRLLVGCISLVFLLVGCSSSGGITGGWGRDYEPATADYGPASSDTGRSSTRSPEEPDDLSAAESAESVTDSHSATSDRPIESRMIEQVLRQELDRWMGVPYVLGGTTLRGVDCSALVQNVFAQALSVQTPRTTDGLIRTGKKIGSSELQPGDLVFFEPGNNYTHVGIFLGEGEFAHASSSRGVMISDLSEAYWRRHYTTSRRILYPDALRSTLASSVPKNSVQQRPAGAPGPHW